MRTIRHASLFSGIGAAELAALWMGWENLFHCEISDFCRTVLNYWFPKSICYEDIKKTDFTKWRGRVDVLTGGFPCQPFSAAGLRLGSDDDRYLWPEMLRAIREAQPHWVIAENVNGILSMVQPGEAAQVGGAASLFGEGDHIFRREERYITDIICENLESEGYSVQPIVIPACSVGAPHRRDRVWFLARRSAADPMRTGLQEERTEFTAAGTSGTLQECGGRAAPHSGDAGAEGLREWPSEIRQSPSSAHADGCGHQSSPANCGTQGIGRKDNGQPAQRRVEAERPDGLPSVSRTVDFPDGARRVQKQAADGGTEESQEEECGKQQFGGADSPQDWWRFFPSVSPVCNGNDGIPFDISHLALPFARWREQSITALGNAMVPQVLLEIFKSVEADILAI